MVRKLAPNTEEEALKKLQDIAYQLGATRAKLVNPQIIIIDERVRLKCKYPPCRNYGRNLMCPPYTPSIEEFRQTVTNYKSALLVQVDYQAGEQTKKLVNSGATLVELNKNPEFAIVRDSERAAAKEKFSGVIAGVEREAFKQGYHLSLGLTTGACGLCGTCELKWPCKHPYEARPSMEGMGIDVGQTMEKAGLPLTWGSTEKLSMNGVVLIG